MYLLWSLPENVLKFQLASFDWKGRQIEVQIGNFLEVLSVNGTVNAIGDIWANRAPEVSTKFPRSFGRSESEPKNFMKIAGETDRWATGQRLSKGDVWSKFANQLLNWETLWICGDLWQSAWKVISFTNKEAHPMDSESQFGLLPQ